MLRGQAGACPSSAKRITEREREQEQEQEQESRSSVLPPLRVPERASLLWELRAWQELPVPEGESPPEKWRAPALVLRQGPGRSSPGLSLRVGPGERASRSQ